MQKSRFPDSLALIFGFIVLAQVLTWVLPAGEFEREGRTVIPGTYHQLPDAGGSWLATAPRFLMAVPTGLESASSIVFLIFVIGGVLGVVKATGAIDALIGAALRAFQGNLLLLIGGTMLILAVGAATIGLAEQYLPFVPILVAMCLALKLDAMVALGIVYGGAAIGFGAAVTNPFTVMVGQEVAGLRPYSGMSLRLVLFVVCLAVGVHHVVRYARRIQADRSLSLVGDVDYSDVDEPRDVPLSPGRMIVIASLFGGIGGFIWGARTLDWRVPEMSAIFLGIGLLAAIFGRLSPNRTAQEFKKEAAMMTSTALLVGFARAIQVVLDEGRVTDTVIHAIAQPLEEIGAGGAAVGMLFVQSLCNLFIPSGSGQGYVTMPIMAPLADLVGITRQTAVLAYQMGDGFTNMVIPTNYVLLGMLGLGRVPYPRWIRFVGPLILKLMLIGIGALLIAVWIDYA